MSALPGTTGRRRIYLMRHGHVDYFSPEVRRTRDFHNVPLTDLGREQAEAAGRALAEVPIDRAVCSGLRRTMETLETTLGQFPEADRPDIETNENLAEIHGSTDGPTLSRDDVPAMMAYKFDAAGEPDARMGLGTDGELFSDAICRASRAIENYLREPGWATMLIVAHEGINRMILGWATGAGLNAVRAFEQDTGCINILDFDLVPAEAGEGNEIERIMLKAVNITPYNYLKQGMTMTSLERIIAPLEKHF